MLAAIAFGVFIGWLLFLWDSLNETYNYWKKKGIECPTPIPLLGNLNPLKKPFSELYAHLYKAYPHATFVGFYEFTKPKILIRDPKLIQQVLIKDFGSFMDRGSENDVSINEVDDTLFAMQGQRWKAVRSKMTPTFTSGRLRVMVPQMTEWAFKLMKNLEQACSVDIEIRELAFSYTTGIIASTAFGLDPQSIQDPNSKFQEMAMRSLKFTPLRFLKLMIFINFPKLAKKLKISFSENDVAIYFSKIIKDTLAQRKSSNFIRNDFVQLLLQLKEKGSVEWASNDFEDDEYLQQDQSQTETFEMTDTLLISQAFSFLSAGSEPVANTLIFALYELALHPEVQERTRIEVEAVMATHRGVSYDALKEMNFLEKCVQETLRKYPTVKQVFRNCTKDYQLPGGQIIEVGTQVVIPAYAIQHDPLFYDHPLGFHPERFYDPPPKGTYLPFGDGPRICIGMRFAITELKVVLAYVLHNFKLIPSPKTKGIKMNRFSFFTSPTHDIYLTFQKIHPSDCTICINK